MRKKKSNAIVVKSNEFVEASYKISLDEMRILLMTIGEIDPRIKNHRRDFEFTVADFAERFGVDPKIAYHQIQVAIDTLGSRWAIIEKTEKIERKVTFLTEQAYFKGEGRFQIILHEKLMPFVSEISERFTSYSLEAVAKLKSFYAIRIYEIISQYKNTAQKTRDVDLKELKEWLQVSDKYSVFQDFKKRVLEPAIVEINEKSDLFVEVQPIKRGRSIHSLRFVMHPAVIVRPKFPVMKSYGVCRLNKQNPKMSNEAYGRYAQDCLSILDGFYGQISDVSDEDLRNYWVFLAVNASHLSKIGTRSDFLDEIRKRGYKIENCELVRREETNGN